MATKKDEKRISEFLDEMGWLFNLNNSEKSFCIMDNDKDDNVSAEVSIDENYQRITIDLYPVFFRESPETQRKTLLHELCHSITLPLQTMMIDYMRGEKTVTEDTVRDLCERKTCQIENILDGLLQGRLRYAKDAYKDYLTKDRKK